MKSARILNAVLALSIGVSLAGCNAKPANTPSTTNPSTVASTAVVTPAVVTPAPTTAVTTEAKDALVAMDDAESAMNAAEDDGTNDASMGIKSLSSKALGDNINKANAVLTSVAPNLGANIKKINAPRVKRAVLKAEIKIRATVKKVQNYLKTNFDRVVNMTIVDNGDGTITEKTTRAFKVKKQGANKEVISERTFTKLDTTVVKDNKVTGGIGQPLKFYHKYTLTLPNGTRTAERTITFNYGDDGKLTSRDVVFSSTATIKGKTQTINTTGTINMDGSETRTGSITLFNGQTLTINTTISATGEVKRTATGKVMKPAPVASASPAATVSASPAATVSASPTATLTTEATVTVELNTSADGASTVTTTDSTVAAPVTETVTEEAEATAVETSTETSPTVDAAVVATI